MKVSMRLLLLIAIGLPIFAWVASAQGQSNDSERAQPVFPSQVNIRRLDVVAVDIAGRPVSDLKSGEVQILEDGVQKDIVSFAAITHPVPEGRRPRVVDITSNARADQGRLVFLVLDDVNALRSRTDFIKATARRLVERLTPEDWVGMLWVGQNRAGALEFTRDHALILRAVDGFGAQQTQVERWFGPDDLVPGLSKFLPQQIEDTLAAPVGAERSLAATASLRAMHDAERPLRMVRDISEQLRSLEARRRVVVYIGQGAERLHTQLDPGPHGATRDLLLPKAITAAKEANVTFYAIDVSEPTKRDARGLASKENTHIGELASVSGSTGGVVSTFSEPAEAADRVIADTSLYYLVGYVTEQARSKERPRHIDVRTTRPGVRVFAQKTYLLSSPANSPRSDREEALRSVGLVIPRHELGLRVFAVPLADLHQKKQPVALFVEATLPELSLVQSGAGFADDIFMTVLAVAPAVGVRASENVSAHLALQAPTTRSFDGRYVICARIEVEPGQYQLRVGLHSAAAARAGSVYLDLSVPNFAARDLSLSGLSVGQISNRDSMPVARKLTIANLMPVVPTLGRDFKAADQAWVFGRVYRGTRARGGRVVIRASIARLDGNDAVGASVTNVAVDLGTRQEGEYRVDLPLSALSIGEYRFRVEAAYEAAELPAAYRELVFRVTAN